jgi:ubiquinone/menaquinone biosynthesis C-methylase UbiE
MSLIARFMRIFFHYFYHGFAWTYDFVAAVVSIGRWKDWVQSALPFIRGNRILEIGHGPGYLHSQLHARFEFVVGLDESAQMGLLTRRRLKKAGYEKLSLTRALAQSTPFPAGTFDTVVSTFPTEFIYSPATLSECHRILNGPGCLIILPAAWILGGKTLDRFAAWLFRITGEAPREISSLVVQRMSHSLEQAGFSTEFRQIERLSSVVIVVIARKIL